MDKLKANYFGFVEKWYNWKTKDQYEEHKGTKWSFQNCLKKFTMVLLVGNIPIFHPFSFSQYTFGPKHAGPPYEK
jgi:hypothetical protein